jgi:Asp-tRNA(Asn)/Glu-tRNA(Gln) amidotransferase A subunit family amidase
MSEFQFATVEDFIAAYKGGSTDPVQVTERALTAMAGLDRLDPPMRTFILVDAPAVKRQAEASAARWRMGQPLSPLDGVPVALKDEFDVAGYPTTCGAKFLGDKRATADAVVVARLRAAGAVLLGKTNMHELGFLPTGLNPWHGAARNPYDPARDTGGSSSGSGAAVGMGLCPVALGNDGGGSIRIPAALCGVSGLKGTFGRVPMDGVPVLCWSLEHAGPLGATIADVLAAFAIITDEQLRLPPLNKLGRPLRLGVCATWNQWASDEVRAIVDSAVEKLARRVNARVVPIELPHIELSLPVGAATFTVEGAAALEPYLRQDQPLSPSTRLSLELVRGMTAVGYVKTQRARALVVRDFERAFENVDAILSPATGMTAPRYHDDAVASDELDETTTNRMVTFTFAENLSGMPAVATPAGYDGEGMPVGLQVVTPHGQDLLALSIAAAVEQDLERRRPRVWYPLL